MKNRLENNQRHIKYYSDPQLLKDALLVLPEKFREKSNFKDDTEHIKEILKWFKLDFFKWIDKPSCLECK
jgi:hypothetical protein